MGSNILKNLFIPEQQNDGAQVQLVHNRVFMTRFPPTISNKLCFKETQNTVTSISTCQFIPQPIDNKIHFVPNRLFVSGFSSRTTQKQLSDAFRMFGEVINCNMVCNQDNSKCYGFVTFRNVASAEAVRSVYSRGRKFIVNGNQLKIKKAQFKPKKTKTPSQVMVRYDKGATQFTNGFPHAQVKMLQLPNRIPIMLQPLPYPVFPPLPPIMYKM